MENRVILNIFSVKKIQTKEIEQSYQKNLMIKLKENSLKKRIQKNKKS